MLQRKYLLAAGAIVLGTVIGLSMPVSAQRGGGAAAGTRISATYKGLTTDRAYQPMPTTSLGADGKVVTTTHPAVKVVPISDQLRQDYNIDPFYTKTISCRGVVVIGSDKVSDWAFLECAYTLDHQFMHSPKWVTDGFASTKVRFSIIAAVEYTMDLPENNRRLRNQPLEEQAFQDRRSRGLGGFPWCSCAEENLLNLNGDPYGGRNPQTGGENITIHEFTHTLGSMIRSLQRQGIGMGTSSAPVASAPAAPGGGGRGRGGQDAPNSWGARMDRVFAQSTSPGGRLYIYNNGRATGVYASNNWQEFWAEGAQAWFDNANPGNSGGLSTRDDVKTKEPGLAELLKEIYGDGEWRYIKTTAKKPDGSPLRPADEFAHLVGLDALRPQMPTFSYNNSPRAIEWNAVLATNPAASTRNARGGGAGGGAGAGRGGRGGRGAATASGPASTAASAPATQQ